MDIGSFLSQELSDQDITVRAKQLIESLNPYNLDFEKRRFQHFGQLLTPLLKTYLQLARKLIACSVVYGHLVVWHSVNKPNTHSQNKNQLSSVYQSKVTAKIKMLLHLGRSPY